jgi:hypothetical protein
LGVEGDGAGDVALDGGEGGAVGVGDVEGGVEQVEWRVGLLGLSGREREQGHETAGNAHER